MRAHKIPEWWRCFLASKYLYCPPTSHSRSSIFPFFFESYRVYNVAKLSEYTWCSLKHLPLFIIRLRLRNLIRVRLSIINNDNSINRSYFIRITSLLTMFDSINGDAQYNHSVDFIYKSHAHACSSFFFFLNIKVQSNCTHHSMLM